MCPCVAKSLIKCPRLIAIEVSSLECRTWIQTNPRRVQSGLFAGKNAAPHVCRSTQISFSLDRGVTLNFRVIVANGCQQQTKELYRQ